MTLCHDTSNDMRVAIDIASDDVKSSLDVAGSQNIKQARCVLGVGTIIKGHRHIRLIGQTARVRHAFTTELGRQVHIGIS